MEKKGIVEMEYGNNYCGRCGNALGYIKDSERLYRQ